MRKPSLYLPPRRCITRKRHRKWLRQLVRTNPGVNPEYLQYETAPYAISFIFLGNPQEVRVAVW